MIVCAVISQERKDLEKGREWVTKVKSRTTTPKPDLDILETLNEFPWKKR